MAKNKNARTPPPEECKPQNEAGSPADEPEAEVSEGGVDVIPPFSPGEGVTEEQVEESGLDDD